MVLPLEDSSITQAVEVEVVVCGWLDEGLRAAVGLTLGGSAVRIVEVALKGQDRWHTPADILDTVPQPQPCTLPLLP